MGRSPRPLLAALDVLHPGLAGSHPLVCRCQRDRSDPLVGPSMSSVTFLVQVFEIVDGVV